MTNSCTKPSVFVSFICFVLIYLINVILIRRFVEIRGANKSWEMEKILGAQGCILSILCESNKSFCLSLCYGLNIVP